MLKNFFKSFICVFLFIFSVSSFGEKKYVADMNSLFRIMSTPDFSTKALNRINIRSKENENIEDAQLIMIGEDHYIAQDILDNFYFINSLLKKESMKDKSFSILFEGSGYLDNFSIKNCSLFFLARVLAAVNRTKDSSLVEQEDVFLGVLQSYKEISKLNNFKDFVFSEKVECNFWDDQGIIDLTMDALEKGVKISGEDFFALAKLRDLTLLRVAKKEIDKGRTVIVVAGKKHLPIDTNHHLFETLSKFKYYLVFHD